MDQKLKSRVLAARSRAENFTLGKTHKTLLRAQRALASSLRLSTRDRTHAEYKSKKVWRLKIQYADTPSVLEHKTLNGLQTKSSGAKM